LIDNVKNQRINKKYPNKRSSKVMIQIYRIVVTTYILLCCLIVCSLNYFAR